MRVAQETDHFKIRFGFEDRNVAVHQSQRHMPRIGNLGHWHFNLHLHQALSSAENSRSFADVSQLDKHNWKHGI